MRAIRHGTMLPSLQQNKIGTSELDPFRNSILGPWFPPLSVRRRLSPSLFGISLGAGVAGNSWRRCLKLNGPNQFLMFR
jgi:hypothetical protein